MPKSHAQTIWQHIYHAPVEGGGSLPLTSSTVQNTSLFLCFQTYVHAVSECLGRPAHSFLLFVPIACAFVCIMHRIKSRRTRRRISISMELPLQNNTPEPPRWETTGALHATGSACWVTLECMRMTRAGAVQALARGSPRRVPGGRGPLPSCHDTGQEMEGGGGGMCPQ